MASVLVNFRLEQKLLKEIDKAVKEGLYGNRTEFVKDALKKKIEEHRTRKALKILEENFGRGKREGLRELSEEEREKIREEVGRESLRRHGLL